MRHSTETLMNRWQNRRTDGAMKKGRLKPKIGFQTTFKLYLQTDSLHLLFRRVDGVLVGIDQNLDAAVLGAAFGCGVRRDRVA